MKTIPYVVALFAVLGTFSQWLCELSLRVHALAHEPPVARAPEAQVNVGFRGMA